MLVFMLTLGAAALNLGANFVQHLGHRGRLHRQQYDVGPAHRGAVVGCDADAQLLAERFGAFAVPHRRGHVRWRHQFLVQEGAQQGAAHLPRPQHGQTFVRKRVAHRRCIFRQIAAAVNQTSSRSPRTAGILPALPC